MALVLDTGVLFAALAVDDPAHEPCRELIETTEEQLIIPAPVLVQLDYWIRKLAGPDVWVSFSEDVHTGVYSLYPIDATLLLRAAQLQARYANLSLDLVDASVFVTCEVLGETKVATLDRRDFAVLRTEDGRALELLPEPARR